MFSSSRNSLFYFLFLRCGETSLACHKAQVLDGGGNQHFMAKFRKQRRQIFNEQQCLHVFFPFKLRGFRDNDTNINDFKLIYIYILQAHLPTTFNLNWSILSCYSLMVLNSSDQFHTWFSICYNASRLCVISFQLQ